MRKFLLTIRDRALSHAVNMSRFYFLNRSVIITIIKKIMHSYVQNKKQGEKSCFYPHFPSAYFSSFYQNIATVFGFFCILTEIMQKQAVAHIYSHFLTFYTKDNIQGLLLCMLTLSKLVQREPHHSCL